jgi:hypothetical protein
VVGASNRYICARAVAPDLRGGKSDKQPKNDTQGRQHTGGDRFERACSS